MVFHLDAFEEDWREIGALGQELSHQARFLLAEWPHKIALAQHAEHAAVRVADGNGANPVVAEESGDFRHASSGRLSLCQS
jgi:hypothetical protein